MKVNNYKECFITTWGHLSQRRLRRGLIWKCLITPLPCSSPFGRTSTKSQGGWRQWWCTDLFCHTGSRMFWQVCNPGFCTFNEYPQSCVFFMTFFSNQNITNFTFILRQRKTPTRDLRKFSAKVSVVCWTVHHWARQQGMQL